MAIFERGADGIVRQVGGLFMNANGGGVKETQSKYVRDKDGVVREIYANGPKIIYLFSGNASTQYMSPQYTLGTVRSSTDDSLSENKTFNYLNNFPKNKCNYVVVNYSVTGTRPSSFGSSSWRGQIRVTKPDGSVLQDEKNYPGSGSFTYYITPGTKPLNSIFVYAFCSRSSSVYGNVYVNITSAYVQKV